MIKQYKHIFFDLDHTLWDFERNAGEAKHQLYVSLNLHKHGISSYEAFREKYVVINTGLWNLYREDKIGKKDLNFKRFYLTMLEFGLDNPQLGQIMADEFLRLISEKTYLFPHAQEILEYLHPKYRLYIITNGFEEVQFPKLKNSGLGKYFTDIITSEEAGVKKPDPAIFKFALKKVNALAQDSLMIGDDLETDVRGAGAAGIDQVFVNHNRVSHSEKPTYEVLHLQEIENIL